jgi:acyl carrier protein phosphodiesterase
MADGFKGQSYRALPADIQLGVRLHRHIDHFTDNHSEIRRLIAHLSPLIGRYTSVAVDILGDYYLANHFDVYSDIPLPLFEQQAYIALKAQALYIPQRYARMVLAIGYNNMLQSYADPAHIQRIFKRVEKRLKHPHNFDNISLVLEHKQAPIFNTFAHFYPELIVEATMYLSHHSNT